MRRRVSGWARVLLGLLALLSVALAGCDLPVISGSAQQRCLARTHGSLGADGGVVVPLTALDPTSSYKTSALFGVRASDGSVAWACASSTYAGFDDAQLVNGVIYALAGTAPTKDAPAPLHAHGLYAIRPQDGKQLWSYTFQAGSTAPLAFDNGLIFVAATTADGASVHSNLYAVRMTTGALVWNASFDGALGWPIIVAHRIVVAVPTGGGQELRAISEQDGSTQWSNALAPNARPLAWVASGTDLYYTDGSSLIALDATTGATRWAQPGLSNLNSQLYSAHGAILLSASQSVLAFDMSTGAMRWSAVMSEQPQLVSVGDQLAYAVTTGSDGAVDHLYALDASSGDVLWQRDAPFGASVTPGAAMATYLTVAAGPQKLSDVLALDQRGAPRWTYTGSSPFAGGSLIPTGDALYYVWQSLQYGASGNSDTITYVTRLRGADGSAQWTTRLDADNAYALPPLLVN